MPDVRSYPVNLMVGQARSAHPFFVKGQFFTKNTSNIWVDEQLRLRRRPGLFTLGEQEFYGPITSMFNYQYRSRASRETDRLIGAFDSGTDGNDTIAGVDIISDRAPGQVLAGADFDYQSRYLMNGTVTVNSGTGFLHREGVTAYFLGGGVPQFVGTVLVDNLNYSTQEGTLIVGVPATSFMPAPTGMRLVGIETGTDVQFTTCVAQTGMRRIWEVAPDDPAFSIGVSNQKWNRNAVVNFAQYGNLLFICDSSYLYPIRVWSGGWADAKPLQQAPRAKYMVVFQDRLWLAGLERNGSELIGSAIGDPYSWKTTELPNSAVRYFIDADDRDAITALSKSYYGDIFIWKRRSMHRLSAQKDPNTGLQVLTAQVPPIFETISKTIGCASHRTVQWFGKDLVWASEKGVHSLSTTDKYGDVEAAYLSFPISDVFANLNFSMAEHWQSVVHERLGLYILGVASAKSKYLDTLLVLSSASRRWMVWDIGDFTSIALGPGVGSEPESVYITQVREVDAGGGATRIQTALRVMDFSINSDYQFLLSYSSQMDSMVTGISTVLEPGLLLSEDEIRYFTKSVSRAQIYHSSPGSFTSTLTYSWDGKDGTSTTIDLNPQGDQTIGTGWHLGGANDIQGTTLRSEDETTTSTVPIRGRGHTFSMKIEDSNAGRLPYLAVDLELEVHDKDYTAASRR